MEDQTASLRRLTPAAQVGRSFAFWECPAAVSPPWSAKWQPSLTAAQRRTLIIDAPW